MIYSKVYRGLLRPSTVFGMPKNIGYLVIFSTMAMVISLSQWWFLIPAAALIVVFNIMNRIDPYFFEIYKYVIKLPDLYE